ncbi:hypothetical protein Cni_G01404 [Canna indica]|uniref:Succinate dehydrogenase subunit 4 n=1 Tax=Canna indica TaxID=4628 RepID=A0AAQ3JP42_9LILI|nr:hypothetical protein Cni_G01404 [Canna indica]
MTSRLLSRSKIQAVSRLLHPSALSDPVSSTQCLRGLGSLASHPLPDPRSAAPRIDRPIAASPVISPATLLGHLGSGKICCNGKILPDCTFSSLSGNAQFLARSLHLKTQCGEMNTQVDNLQLRDTNMPCTVGVEKPNCFSPLEGTLTRERKSELVSESWKVKRMELSLKTTYALIPPLLLISKTKLTTSMLIMCIYWQAYGFFKEIFLDYVHHEVTRKWVLIYFKLLLFILAKDTVLAFDLV